MANASWKEIGKRLQQARKDAGYKSAQSFAECIGMKTSAYTEYEQGRRMFNYEQAWIMADALECSMDELGGRSWPPQGAPQLAFSDERQRRVNADFERVNEAGKDRIASDAGEVAEMPKYQKSTRDLVRKVA